MRIPAKYIIRKQNPIVKEVCDQYNFNNDVNGEILCLLVFLSSEKKKSNSPFKEYFSALPKNYNSLPFYYSEKDLELAKNTLFIDIIGSRTKKRNKVFYYLTREKNFNISKAEFEYLYYTITTRSYSPKAVAPYGDMFNTGPQEILNAKWEYDNSNGDIIIRSKKDIKKDEEVLILYMYKWNNFDFLESYGFTLPILSNEEYKIGAKFNIKNRGVFCTPLYFWSKPKLNNYQLEEFDKCAQASEITEKNTFKKIVLKLIKNALEEKNKSYLTKLEVRLFLYFKIGRFETFTGT
jgi:hypothetical protein